MLAGRAEPAGTADAAILRRRYLNAHPSAEAFVDFKDFSFFRIRPTAAHLVAGFGRIVDLEPGQFLTDISDAGALLEAEQSAIEHMNADHRDAIDLYATRLLGAAPGRLAMHRLRSRRHRHAGGQRDVAAGFSAADCHRCRIAGGAEAACRSGPHRSKHLSRGPAPPWNKPKPAGSAWQARRSSVIGRRTKAGRLY